jgi:integrase
MTITKRKDGRYTASLSNPKTGKREYIYGKTQAEVKRKYNARLRELLSGEDVKPTYTVSYCIDKWFEVHQDSGIGYNTIESYRKPVADCKAYFGTRKLSDILPCDIDDFIKHLVDCDYKRQTINLRYIVMCKTFDWAIKNRIVSQNSARDTALPMNLPKGRRSRLTREQVRKVIDSKDLYANTLLFTGTRRCECLALRWEDVDFEKREIRISQQVIWKRGEEPALAPLKTNASNGTIPLLQPLYDLLKPVSQSRGFIFNSGGKLLTARQFQYGWRKFTESIDESGGIEPHMFRHEYVSLLHDAGIDVKSAQVLARHSKFETTMNIYTELEENSTEKLGEKLNSFLSQK